MIHQSLLLSASQHGGTLVEKNTFPKSKSMYITCDGGGSNSLVAGHGNANYRNLQITLDLKS